MHRRHFLDRELLYLFSYNAEIDPLRKNIGLVPEGVRFDVSGVPSESRVFHVLRERTETGLPPGAKVVTGRVRIGNDTALYQSDDVVVDDIRLTIETDVGRSSDPAIAEAVFSGWVDSRSSSRDGQVGDERATGAGSIVIEPGSDVSPEPMADGLSVRRLGCIQLQYDFIRRVPTTFTR